MVRLLSWLAAAPLCALACACSKPAAPPAAPSDQSTTTSAAAVSSAPGESDKAAVAAAIAALPAPYNTGDVDDGEAKFAVCRSCHSIEAGAPAMTGPNLHGVVGRKAASAAGYAYSDALKGAGLTWDAASLDKWLSGPSKDVPGTKMTFIGLPNPKDRIDVIAYLTANSAN